jgi:hypothetical protein
MSAKEAYKNELKNELKLLKGQKARAEEKLIPINFNTDAGWIKAKPILNQVELLDEDIRNKEWELSELE